MKRRVWMLALLGPVVVGACASDAPGRAAERSNTPEITIGAPADEVEALLLSDADLRDISGLEGAVGSTLDDAALWENPDIRGPCGAELSSVPEVETGRAFTAGTSRAFQLLYVDDAEVVARYVDDLEADLRPGCGPYESLNNLGAVQRVSEPVPVDTQGIGDRSLALLSVITVGDMSAEVGTVVVVAGGRATLLQVTGPAVDGGQLVALADSAAARLER